MMKVRQHDVLVLFAEVKTIEQFLSMTSFQSSLQTKNAINRRSDL